MAAPPVITSFTANVYLIIAGQSVTLSWTTSQALSGEINGVIVGTSGSKSYGPTTTTTYTLKAYNEGGQTSKSLTIVVTSVVPPPTPPPTKYYSLTIYTNPTGCTVTVSDVGTGISNSSGALTIPSIPAGSHNVTVSKYGYDTRVIPTDFVANKTMNVSLAIASVICTPGALKCIGVDLYVCNTTGTAWTLKTANSPTCKTSGAIPDFWTDPVGWVIGTITTAWEAMLGFVSGQFNVFLQNLKTFQNNFMAQLVAFISDPVTKLKAWLTGIWTTLTQVVGEVTKGITNWWTTASQSVMGWINGAIKSANDWIANFTTTIAAWWATTSKSIVDTIGATWNDIAGWIGDQWDNIGEWWDDQVLILQRGWDATFGQIPGMITGAINTLRTWIDGVVISLKALITAANKVVTDWVNDQIGILQRGWDLTLGNIPGLINDAVLGIKAYIFDVVPGIVEGVILGLIESIPGLKTVIDFIGSLYDTITKKYPEDPQIQETKQTAQAQQTTLKNLISKW